MSTNGLSDNDMEIIGWIGTTLVIIAYGPQIHHLWAEKCAWGISLWMWFIWLVSSAMLLSYSWFRGEVLFIVVQGINILAIVATIVLTRRSNHLCSHHLSKINKKRG
ncbi:MAG TPA: PQ-loop repeat-containing protein [Pyrinomonadaceae bacterium]|nr:PQ-loop repeat-containing protein [Pyrinomonadaceae bacterium]